MNSKKKIGIIGGMGPLATCDLMEKIINNTDAQCDQDYIQIYVDCNTSVPDRTAAILHGGADPLPELVKSALRLQNIGADYLVMACNTAHYFCDKIQEFVDIPIVDMPFETACYIREMGVKRAGVIATDGSLKSGIYRNALEKAGIDAIYPDDKDIELIMHLIYGCVKAGKPIDSHEKAAKMIQHMIDKGAQTLVLGCTELPLAFEQIKTDMPTVDPTEIVARRLISLAGGKLKENVRCSSKAVC